jgi:hypothetical protein
MAETRAGYALFSFMMFAGAAAFLLRTRLARRHRPADVLQRYDALTGAILAYVCYTASAFLVHVPLPEFFREHLFDGFAPAALVGYLVTRVPSKPARTAEDDFRLVSVVLLWVGGSLIFALIAAAAVFASGSNEFLGPVVFGALSGGTVFGSAWIGSVLIDATPTAEVFRAPPVLRAPPGPPSSGHAHRRPAVRLTGGKALDLALRAVNQAASEDERGDDPENSGQPGH